MKNIKFIQLGLSSSLALLAGAGGLSDLASAQSVESALEENLNVSFNPPKSGTPDSTAGGATRGGRCPQDANLTEPSLVPVVPGEYAGLTTAERPSFLTYIGDTSASQLFFSLKSLDGTTVHQAYIPITAYHGLIDVSLPENVTPLEINTGYQWSIVLVCGESLRPSDPTWTHRIERIQLDAEEDAQVASMAGLERAAWYGQKGIWYDAASSLASAQLSQDSWASAWESLMLSVGLDAISTATLLP